MIEDALDTRENKITWKEIAEAAGITKGALSHFKSGTELKFPTLLKVSNIVFGKNHFAAAKTWSLLLHNPKNVRFAMEYLAVNKLTKELEELIEKATSEHTSREVLEWANAYSIVLMYLKNETTSSIIEEIRAFQPKSEEMKILTTIIEVSCKNRTREYNSMASLIDGLHISIENIEEDYIKQSFKLRLKELQSYVALYRNNDPVTARKHAYDIINADLCATLTAHSYYIVGMSYLFDNYDLCLGNIEKYQGLLIGLGREKDALIVEKNDIPFIKNLWKTAERRPDTNDISEIAHFEAMLGSKEEALELADKAIEENGKSGFNLYYKALATDDKSMFMQSLIFFVSKKGDMFFANLPYRYLKDDPTFAPMAQLLFND